MITKHYGFGIVDKNGKPYLSEGCVSNVASHLEAEAAGLNADDPENAPYRVVELLSDNTAVFNDQDEAIRAKLRAVGKDGKP